MEVNEERLRAARGSLELKAKPDGKEGVRRGSGKGQKAFNRTGAIAPPRSVEAYLRPGKDGNIERL